MRLADKLAEVDGHLCTNMRIVLDELLVERQRLATGQLAYSRQEIRRHMLPMNASLPARKLN